MPALRTIATSVPSRNTSTMLQRVTQCSARIAGRNAAERRPSASGSSTHRRSRITASGNANAVAPASNATACWPVRQVSAMASGRVASTCRPPRSSVTMSATLPMMNTSNDATDSASRPSGPRRWPRPSSAPQRVQRATWLEASRSRACTASHSSHTTSAGYVATRSPRWSGWSTQPRRQKRWCRIRPMKAARAAMFRTAWIDSARVGPARAASMPTGAAASPSSLHCAADLAT